MRNKLIIFSIGIFSTLFPTERYIERYLPIREDIYAIVEYNILQSTSIPVFVLDQPYSFTQIDQILSNSEYQAKWDQVLFSRYVQVRMPDSHEKIGVSISPGYGYSGNAGQNLAYPALFIDGNLAIGNITIVNSFRLDKSLTLDKDFHGDTNEWLMGYFDETYLSARLNKNIEIFAGRLARNFGALNDFSLILSNNPYTFDHYGFSATGSRYKYSFYTTRLNDIMGEDIQGVTMPADTLMNTHRYWAIQRFETKIRNNLQLSFSEATVYGGPHQNFVASFINPVQFFYAAQRNQNVQLNSFWQIGVFYKPIQKISINLDFFVDDLIVNNNAGVNDRDRYPDRLGVLCKLSKADLLGKFTLSSLRYVRIWNDTYQSFRTFENYLYFNKSIGFPLNSYEGIKLSNSWLNFTPLYLRHSLEIWRHGDISLHQPFDGEIKEFPVKPVIYGLTQEIQISVPYYQKFEIELNIKNQLSSNLTNDFFGNAQSTTEFNFKLLYQFQFSN